MKTCLALAVVVVVVTLINAERCSYNCGTTKCGWWNTKRCTKTCNCDVSTWTNTPKPCSKPCGGGSQIVERRGSCANGRCSLSRSLTRACNSQPCPVDGGWTDFRETSRTSCSVTCGTTGTLTITKTRSCTNPQPQYGGQDCVGDPTMTLTETCNRVECPIDGGWSDWVPVTKCTVLCGGGTKDQVRTCTNPAPQYGGQNCTGRSEKTRKCNNEECGDLCPGNDTYIAAGDRRYFYHCQYGDGITTNTTARLKKCGPKTVWNQTVTACVHKKKTTTTTTTNSDTCDFSNLRADSDDCSIFYQCANGKRYTHTCPAGTLFDQSIQACNTASLVTC